MGLLISSLVNSSPNKSFQRTPNTPRHFLRMPSALFRKKPLRIRRS